MSVLLSGKLLAAFCMGISMAGHCLGMCGPLVSLVAISGPPPGRWRVVGYNLGRLSTYALMGMLVGSAGKGMQLLFTWTWIPKAMMITSILVIFYAALVLLEVVPEKYMRLPFPTGRLAKLFKPEKSHVPEPLRMIGLGLVLGFLPCAATLGMPGVALATGIWCEGGLVMLAFGMVTLPVMAGLPLVMQFTKGWQTGRFRWVAGILLLVTGGITTHHLWGMVYAT